MSGITKILTRTPGELGSIKTNKSPIVEENKQLPAEQWNTAADAIIEIQTVIGEAANPAAGTIMDVLNDHEERIDELEQNGGGGGGTPGHVICNVTEDDPPIEPVPQRKNLVFFSDTADIVVTDFEELDTTIVDLSGILEGVDAILSRASDDPNNKTFARASVYSSYASGESNANFSITLYDHNSRESYLQLERAPLGERFVVGLGHRPGDLVFEVNDHTFYGDKEFRLRNAPTLIETPVKPDHAATKGYVDARLPDLEWWEPVWTPVSNVDSVSNVECQYTRTYRTAGGSLVTLEGTIEVTPDAADTMTMVSVDLPVPRDGVDMVAGIGSFSDYDGDDFGLARVGVADLGAGQQVALQYTPSTDAVHRVSFRVSYRAA